MISKCLKRLVICGTLTTLLFSSARITAQVTIGDTKAPVAGALLDLREANNSNKNGATADKGLGMPRVKILSPKQIVPEGYSGEVLDKDHHIGLFVFNVNQKDGDAIASRDEMLCPGPHVWNGLAWDPLVPYPASGKRCTEADLPEINGFSLLYFVSGQNLNGNPVPADLNLTWTPTESSVSMVKSGVVVNGVSLPQIVFNTEPSATIPAGGSNDYTLSVAPMTQAEVESNPFATKAVNLTFTALNENNEAGTYTATIYQTNRALTVNGRNGSQVIRHISDSPRALAIAANTKWNAILGDDTQSSVSVSSGGEYTDTNAATYNNTTLYSSAIENANAGVKEENVDYIGASPGTGIFKTGTSKVDIANLAGAMMDVCNMPQEGIEKLPHASAKFRGGISILINPHVAGGEYKTGPTSGYARIWTPSLLAAMQGS